MNNDIDFKLWLEEQLEKDIVQKIVFDAAGVSGVEALSNPIKAHQPNLYKLLNRGVIKPYRNDIEALIRSADSNRTLNDLINYIVKLTSNQEQEIQ